MRFDHRGVPLPAAIAEDAPSSLPSLWTRDSIPPSSAIFLDLDAMQINIPTAQDEFKLFEIYSVRSAEQFCAHARFDSPSGRRAS